MADSVWLDVAQLAMSFAVALGTLLLALQTAGANAVARRGLRAAEEELHLLRRQAGISVRPNLHVSAVSIHGLSQIYSRPDTRAFALSTQGVANLSPHAIVITDAHLRDGAGSLLAEGRPRLVVPGGAGAAYPLDDSSGATRRLCAMNRKRRLPSSEHELRGLILDLHYQYGGTGEERHVCRLVAYHPPESDHIHFVQLGALVGGEPYVGT